jgi:hypothetical protein
MPELETELQGKPQYTELVESQDLKKKDKDSKLDRETRQTTNQKNERDRRIGYIQNAEQSESTLWKRVKERQK